MDFSVAQILREINFDALELPNMISRKILSDRNTVCKIQNFTLSHFFDKIRESNMFTKEVTKE